MSLLSDLKWVSCHFRVTEVLKIRDREETKKRILEAVGSILEKRGFNNIGINNIAREAGIDKVLIYRYFGGLPELLHKFAEQGNFWPSLADIAPGELELSEGSMADSSLALLNGYFRELKKRDMAQELLRGELAGKNDLSAETAEIREKQGKQLIEMLSLGTDFSRDLDIPAVASILSAGFTYLLLRAKTSGTYLGIDLNSDEDWKRIEKALELLVRSFFSLHKDEDSQ